MCLILFAYHVHPAYPLILLANRDEYYLRPSQPAHWWQQHPELLAGRDLRSGGTWLGVNRRGEFAAITNVREGPPGEGSFRSRGLLPLSYLTRQESSTAFSQTLVTSPHHYRGYNLLYGSLKQLCYFSNRQGNPTELKPGIYGLSNALLETPWPKLLRGKELLALQLARPEPVIDDLFRILADEKVASDDQLPQTGISIDLERRLSAICIRGKDYGTRSSTIVTISCKGRLTLHEQERAPQRGPTRVHSVQLDNE
jgi:uncharacterized protein with NRDE domain